MFFKEKLKQFKFKLHKTEPQKSFIRIKHQTTCLKKFKLFFLIVYSKATIIELKKKHIIVIVKRHLDCNHLIFFFRIISKWVFILKHSFILESFQIPH